MAIREIDSRPSKRWARGWSEPIEFIALFPDLVRIQSQVGRTELRVSAVGIGTYQFQVLPERQAERYIARTGRVRASGCCGVARFDAWEIG